MFGWLKRLFGRRKPAPVHIEPVVETPLPPPDVFPWRLIGSCAVGGLRSLGFQPESDLLLIVSEGGRIVVDGRTAVQVARDPMRYLVGQDRGEALGIGPLAGQVIQVAGIYGGRLAQETSDGWRLAGAGADLVVVAPDGAGYGLGASGGTILAGFSPTGRTLVVAEAAEVAVYGR
jgi:hypothetical protein